MEQLTINGEHLDLARVSEWVAGMSELLGLTSKTAFAINLCLEEAVTNTIKYGLKHAASSRKSVFVSMALAADCVIVTVADHGAMFDPLAISATAVAQTVEGASIGGLGIPLMRRFTRSMSYSRDGDMNRLILEFPID